MLLPLQNFTGLVEQMAASVQGTTVALIDVSVGTVLRAVLEASASIALWLQWLILQVLSMTRAATSNGPDLDSWMADYGLVRLPASAAVGTVTFGRYTVGLAASIPVGTTVRTMDGSQSFAVIASAGTPGWDGVSAYDLAAAATSIAVPVQAQLAGSAGNVQAQTITILASAVPGVDTVVNAAAFGGGMNAETDSALRSRFMVYINSRSLATLGAVGFSVASVQQGLRYAIAENQDPTGRVVPGSFVVTVDDGTGSPPAALLASVQGSVDAVRPLGSTYAVAPPVVVTTAVQMTIEVSATASETGIAAEIVTALTAWIEQLPIGGVLAISKLIALAHGVDPSVLSVSDVSINGKDTDLVLAPNAVAICGSVVVS